MVDCDTEQESDLEHSMLFSEEIWNTTDEEEQKRRKSFGIGSFLEELGG